MARLFSLFFFCGLLGLAGLAPAQAQQVPSPTAQSGSQAKPSPTPAPAEQDSVVRISTQLVQIDATITDGKGSYVDDLKEEEIELLLDGKRQPLTYFSLIKNKRETPVAPPSKTPGASPKTMPTRNLEPENVARTIAFVVDDLGLSFESTHYTREALKQFVAQQMQEGDLVGIIRTGRGLGALQQFTSDKRILYAAIEKLDWNPNGRDMIPRFAPAGSTAVPPGLDEESRQAREQSESRFEDFRETVFSVGTLGAVNFVVRGLRELPGRKMVVLISDGFRLFGRERDNTQVLETVRRLADLANRSSVVIYSLDARGLQVLGATAADNLNGMSPAQMSERLSQQSQALFDTQDGLSYVARETGGFAILNSNDLNAGISKVLRDNETYYLIGFDPEDSSFDRRYHNIKLRLTRPGLRARTRAGFFGTPDTRPRLPVAETAPKSRDEQILATLYSPFGARDLSLQMTSFFFNVQQPPALAGQSQPQASSKKDKTNQVPAGTVSFVRSFFHIDASKLSFTDDADGRKQLQLELVTFAFNEQGQIVDQHGRAFTTHLDPERYQVALKLGFFYRADIPLKQPGAYQFRAVVRDARTGRVGSASQFIQVPDLRKKQLAMSGLIITGKTLPPGGQPGPDPAATSAQAETENSVALRQFPRNFRLIYGFQVYNSTFDAKTQRPDLWVQAELYKDGKPLHLGPARPVPLEEKVDPDHLTCSGEMQLSDFKPGEYLLRIVVTDKLAKQKYRQVDQWMDFRVR